MTICRDLGRNVITSLAEDIFAANNQVIRMYVTLYLSGTLKGLFRCRRFSHWNVLSDCVVLNVIVFNVIQNRITASHIYSDHEASVPHTFIPRSNLGTNALTEVPSRLFYYNTALEILFVPIFIPVM
jgi:hypothetical protein